MQGGSTQPVAVEGKPVVAMADQPEVSVRILTPGFLSAMRIPVLRGRDFQDNDTATSLPVIVVSESMAKQFWPNENPIGKRLTMTFVPGIVREVVGVVGDVKDRGLDNKDPISTLYYPFQQFKEPAQWGKFRAIGLEMAVRTSNEPTSVTSAIRNTLHEISPSTPLLEVKTMQELVDESLSSQRFNMFLLAAFAGLALLLAAVGIYSVLAYTVRQRTREIGVRMALGASESDVVRLILREGATLATLGIVLGVAGTFVATPLIRSWLFGIDQTDPQTIVAAAIGLVLIALGASWLPARRASKVDPLLAMRGD
jgi:predicted permease